MIKDEFIVPYLIHRVNIINNVGNRTELTLSDYPYYRNRGYKPILRPLSDLNIEIEIDGKKFTPIEVLGKLHEPNGTLENEFFGWDVATGGDDYQDYYYEIQKHDNIIYEMVYCGEPTEEYSYVTQQSEISYRIMRLLFEWHFDVFGLITQKFAININEPFLTEC